MSDSKSLNLCLINNDPLATLLVASTGQCFYSIKTPPSCTKLPSRSPVPVDSPSAIDKSQRPTSVFRLEGGASSMGQVETQVGTIHPSLEQSGLSTVDLYLEKVYQLAIESAGGRSTESGPLTAEPEKEMGLTGRPDSSWNFVGPDQRNYTWQMFIKSPILVLSSSTLVPLARYRRAKIGIVSRPRKAFLEIMPEGLGVLDMIVVTFVAFMKHRVPMNLRSFQNVGDESRASSTSQEHLPTDKEVDSPPPVAGLAAPV